MGNRKVSCLAKNLDLLTAVERDGMMVKLLVLQMKTNSEKYLNVLSVR